MIQVSRLKYCKKDNLRYPLFNFWIIWNASIFYELHFPHVHNSNQLNFGNIGKEFHSVQGAVLISANEVFLTYQLTRI